jgi:integrase
LKLGLRDLTEDGLVIRATKFQKSRLVPLDETARHSLQQYVAARRRFAPTVTTLFVSRSGGKLAYSAVNTTFLLLTRAAGLRGGPGQQGCRLHDLRHTFAVRSLEQCPPDRRAVAQHITMNGAYLRMSQAVRHRYTRTLAGR